MLKVILIIVIVLIVLFAGAMLFFFSYSRLNDKELELQETVLKGNTDKKALVLYQESKHDTCKNITNALAEALNSQGYTVTINHPSSKLTYNVDDYDVFAFGSAVYMGQTSKPLVAYMDSHSFSGKKVMVYCVGAQLEVNAEINAMKDKVKGATKVEGIKVKKGQEENIKQFALEFLSK